MLTVSRTRVSPSPIRLRQSSDRARRRQTRITKIAASTLLTRPMPTRSNTSSALVHAEPIESTGFARAGVLDPTNRAIELRVSAYAAGDWLARVELLSLGNFDGAGGLDEEDDARLPLGAAGGRDLRFAAFAAALRSVSRFAAAAVSTSRACLASARRMCWALTWASEARRL